MFSWKQRDDKNTVLPEGCGDLQNTSQLSTHATFWDITDKDKMEKIIISIFSDKFVFNFHQGITLFYENLILIAPV